MINHPGQHKSSDTVSGPKPWFILALSIPGLLLLPFAIAASILGARYRRRVERGSLQQNRMAQVGLVLGASGILLGMIQLCAFIYLLPVIMHGWKPEADEAHAVHVLRELRQIQEDYKRLTGSYAATTEMLKQRGFIKSGFTDNESYRFEIKISEKDGVFGLRAIPFESGRPCYYIDQTDVLRRSEGPEVGPESSPVGATHSGAP
jgi:hypothetical protein